MIILLSGCASSATHTAQHDRGSDGPDIRSEAMVNADGVSYGEGFNK